MFVSHKFTVNQVKKYFASAGRDYKIAGGSDVPEIIFRFSYDALIKLAIAVCARNGLRVKSRTGHHAELLEKMAGFLNEPDFFDVGNEMRKKRNLDMYGGGTRVFAPRPHDFPLSQYSGCSACLGLT